MTMREEFEAEWRKRDNNSDALLRDGDSYAYSDVRIGWTVWQAAYAAGQRAEREVIANEVRLRAEGFERDVAHLRWTNAEWSRQCRDFERFVRVLRGLAAAIRNPKAQG